MVIAKFRVDMKTEFPKWDDTQDATPFQVKMTGVQSEPFGKYTPSASLDMLILNDDAAKQFIPGKEYTVKFEAVE